jgi:hypothetical protein
MTSITEDQEGPPLLDEIGLRNEVGQRGVSGSPRSAKEPHTCLLRCSAPFSSVATKTTAHNVVPRGGATIAPGDHMIEIQIPQREGHAAVLAGVLVPNQDKNATESKGSSGLSVIGH